MIRRRWVVIALTTIVVAVPGLAFAAWALLGSGAGASKADQLPIGPTPSVSVTGRNVALTWSAVTFSGGGAVGGYRVFRYPSGGGAAQTVLSACDGTISGLTCTENAVPAGSWKYTLATVKGGWTGTQGALSAVAAVGSPAFAFSSSATVTSLPATLAGTVSDFITGETVTFHLDAAGGALLTGSTAPSPIPASGAATTSTTIPAGTSDGTHTVFAVGSLGDTASATVTLDGMPPVVSAAVIGKSVGGTVGSIRQGGTYYVYANVSDAGSGVTSATADVSAITSGSTAVALTAGSYTAGGVTYGYRSALLTASNPLSAGSKSFSITATDGNAHGGTTTGFTVTVDNTVPAASDVQTANNAGGVAGKAETSDSITFTFSEPIDPSTIVSGWDGSGSQTVTVHLVQNGTSDRVEIFDSTNATQLAFGAVQLGDKGYTTTNRTFTTSTLTMSGSTFTVVLGTPSGAVGTVATTSTMQWAPLAGATDWAGNACSTATANESGAADIEF